MNTLQTFTFAGSAQVRMLSASDGRRYIVAKDLAEALGLTNSSAMVTQSCMEQPSYHEILTSGGPQQMRCITHADALRVVISSRKELAAPLQEWLLQQAEPSNLHPSTVLTKGITSTELHQFQFAGQHRIRTLLEDGEIKFVARDVCELLGLGNTSMAMEGLEANEVGISVVRSDTATNTLNTLTESGLYALIFKSRKPEAQTFRKWVTSEVLPTLRRTGTYTVVPAPPPPQFDLPKTFSEALRLLADTHEHAEALKLQVEAQKPAVEFVSSYVQAEGTFGLRETAKLLGLPPRQFTTRLQKQHLCFRENGHLQPYAEHLRDGYFTLRTGESHEHAYTQTRVTPKGIEWLRRKLGLPAQISPAHNILQLTA